MVVSTAAEKKTEDMLVGVEPMIWSILNGFNGISKQDKEDLKQEAMIYLHNKVLPRWNPKIAKFSSFAYRCVTNFIMRKVQNMNRRRNLECDIGEYYKMKAEFEIFSDDIEKVRDKIKYLHQIVIENPKKFKPKEVQVVMAIFENPSVTQREISEKMGYKRPSAVSMIMLRLRRRLNKLKFHDMF